MLLIFFSVFVISSADSDVRWNSKLLLTNPVVNIDGSFDMNNVHYYDSGRRNKRLEKSLLQRQTLENFKSHAEFKPSYRDKRATVDADDRFLDLQFAKEPSDLVVAKDQSAVLDCSVSLVSSVGKLDIYWQKNGAKLKIEEFDQRLAVLNNGSLLISRVIGARGQDQSDDGSYQCFASVDHLGKKWTFFSRKARLTVAVLPRFEEQPQDRKVTRGETVVLPCRVDAVPVASVDWYKDNVLLKPDRDRRLSVYPLTGSLEIKDVGISDASSYKCKVSNPDKYRHSREGRLTVVESEFLSEPTQPRFEVQPKGQVLNVGQTAVLECACNGYPEPRITWLKDHTELVISGRFSRVGQGTLVIQDVEATDAGVYTCRSLNSEDSIDSSASIEVQVPPKIVLKPKNKASEETVDIIFNCSAHGFPGPNINWYKNGELIHPSQFFVIDGTDLRVLGLIKGDQGVYQCLAENEAGSAQASAQLIVETAEGKNTSPAVTPQASQSSSPDDIPESSEGTERPPPPSEPLNLHSTLESSRSVSLRWNPPLQTNGDIVAYSVYYKLEGSDRERVINTSRSGDLELSITVLEPNSLYNFRVVAYNKNGPGLSSAPIKIRTKEELAVPGKVKNLRGSPSSSSSIEIRWDPPEAEDFVLTYYRLFYAKSDSTENAAEDETEIRVPWQQSHYVLHGLEKFTSYVFRVEAHSDNGAGLPSESIVVKTYSDVPSGSPRELSVEPTGAQSVVIKWKPPFKNETHGVITGYKIRYKNKRRGSKAETIVTDGNTREHRVDGLQSGSTYQFRIHAITVNGTGPGSSWAKVTTYNKDMEEEQVPGPPTSLKVQPHNDRIQVSWTPPLDDGIMIRGYLIGWGINVPDVKQTKVDGNRRYHEITGLRPNRDYVISLRAYNSMGNGFPIYETVRTLEHGITLNGEQEEPLAKPMETPVGVRAYALSSVAVRLTWSDPSAPGSYHRGVQRPADGRHRNRFVNASKETMVVIDGLQPDTQYEFYVRVSLGRLTSEWSMAAVNKTKTAQPSSAPRDLTAAVSASGDPLTVLLNWQPPKFANGEIIEYLIYYTYDPTLPDSKWKLEGIRGDRLSTSVDDLLPKTTYYFKIQARNKKGYGPLSAVLAYKTTASGAGIGIVGIIVVLCLILVCVIVYCCNQRWSRNRSGYMAGKKSYTQKTGVKQPPDLWIGLAPEKTVDQQGTPSTSMQDIKHALHQRSPSPGSQEPPRYHSLADCQLAEEQQLSSGRRSAGGNGTLERRRVGRAKPIMMQPVRRGVGSSSSTAGSDVEGSTLSRSYHQSGSLEVVHPPNSSRQRTPQVVYTGPRNQHPAKTTVALESPYGSSRHMEGGFSPTPPPQEFILKLRDTFSQIRHLPNGAPPPAPPPGAVHSEGVRTLPRNENPLKSFTAMAAPPPPHHPPETQCVVSGTPPRTHMVRPVPITVVASPHRSIGTTPGGKPAGIVIGTRAGVSSHSPAGCRTAYSPRFQNYPGGNSGTMSDTNAYSSGKETDTEIPHSYSTEELNVQIENLDTLMEDLQSMSKNEFNVV